MHEGVSAQALQGCQILVLFLMTGDEVRLQAVWCVSVHADALQVKHREISLQLTSVHANAATQPLQRFSAELGVSDIHSPPLTL